ncbi:MAG: hypothetical protein LBJ67_15825 [Planctomycetaceae bacterium]|nr:hypothetical protein [Planctomycetaceae bacterium]
MTNLQTNNKFNELHLFIDESGRFYEENDINIVGGVLLFGSYDDAVQSGIKNAMLDACRVSEEQYPVHFHQLTENTFAVNLSKNLEVWKKETDTAIYGVLMQHKEDIFDNAPHLIAERELDNRYLAMIWELIEYLVFVSNKVNTRLTEDAEIHLHIAHRRFTIPRDGELKTEYESLGYKVTDNYYVKDSFHPLDIAMLFRQTMRKRWTGSQRKLAKVKLEWLDYDSAKTTPAMYLADIVIGVERKRIQNWTTMKSQQILPILESLEYGKELNAAMQCKAYLASGNIEGLIGELEKNPFNPDDLQNQEIVNALVAYYKKNKKPFQRLYETAEKLVDHPLERDRAIRLSELLDAIVEKSGEDNLLFQLYSLLVQFSFTNHTGNTQKSNDIWENWLKYESHLPSIGLEYGLKFYTEFRLRRAVNLMDMFQYSEAETVLLDGITKEEDCRVKIAALFGCEPDRFDSVQIGKIYNTLGQLLAFQGNDLQWAENSFRYAIECFKDANDIERSWVYLGHLACDHPNELRQLWDEVAAHLPSGENPYEKPFVLALKLKAVLVFYDNETKIKWAEDVLTVLENCPDFLRRQHTFGMITQTTAMIYAQLRQETGNENMRTTAHNLFDSAIDSFSHGEGLLKHIGNICKLRKKQLHVTRLMPEEQEQINQLRFNYW